MIGDFSPCQYLAKAEGLQLAKASFRWKPRYNLTLAQQHRFMGLHALFLLFLLDHITSVSTAYRMDTRIRTDEFYFAAPPVLLCSLAFCSHFGTRLFLIVSSWSESQAVLWDVKQICSAFWVLSWCDRLLNAAISASCSAKLFGCLQQSHWGTAAWHVVLGKIERNPCLPDSQWMQCPDFLVVVAEARINFSLKHFNHGKATVVGVVHLLA